MHKVLTRDLDGLSDDADGLKRRGWPVPVMSSVMSVAASISVAGGIELSNHASPGPIIDWCLAIGGGTAAVASLVATVILRGQYTGDIDRHKAMIRKLRYYHG